MCFWAVGVLGIWKTNQAVFWFPQAIVDLSNANKPERFGWTFWNIFGSHVAKAVVVNQHINLRLHLNNKRSSYTLCAFFTTLTSICLNQHPTSSSLKKRAGGSRGARTVLATFHQGFGSDDIDDMSFEKCRDVQKMHKAYHPCMVYLLNLPNYIYWFTIKNQPNVGKYTIHGWYG